MSDSMDLLLRLLLGLLASTGLATSLVFGLKALGNKEVEVNCKDGSCIRLSKTPYAAVFFRIPNWVFGILYYTITLLAVMSTYKWFVAASVLGAVVSTLLSIFLMWSLAVKLKAMCKLCYLSHAVNASLLVIWIVSMFLVE